MQNNQYSKYKQQFKTNCILKAVTSAFAVLAVIFLLFLLNFKIKVIEGLVEIEFSLFDEIKLVFSGMSSSQNAMMFLDIYQIFAIIFSLYFFSVCYRNIYFG